ncbi:MAG: hypothetical protein MUE95_05675 [Cyclobacteriaceae bacterium]|jgi:hypothetical protein|nr:hypothetical protein [Cyclobacteriaceae bacterium]
MSKKSGSEKKSSVKKPRVHKELQGFEISIDSFGELSSNMSIDKLNEFLNKNVDDKKLAEREDYEEMKKGRKKKKKD